MTSIRFIYILLHLLEIYLLYTAGKKMAKTSSDNAYWSASKLAFISYILVHGFRFGFEIDWNLYCERYMDATTMEWDKTEPIFNFVIYFLNTLGIPYFIFITLQVCFFLYAFLLIAKDFKPYLKYILPLTPLFVLLFDNYIRWYFAVTFLLLAINAYLHIENKKILWTALFFVCGVFVHNGIVPLAAIFVCFIFKNKFLPSKFTIPVLFVSCYFLSISMMNFLSEYAIMIGLFLQSTGIEVDLAKYLEKVDAITTDGLSDLTSVAVYSIKVRTFLFLTNLPIILYGKRFLESIENGYFIYNIYVIGIILYPVFSTVEIFDRFACTMLIFQSIVAGVVYFNILQKSIKLRTTSVLCMISLACVFYPYTRQLLSMKKEYRMMYIWDSEGKKYVNPQKYYNDMMKNKKSR